MNKKGPFKLVAGLIFILCIFLPVAKVQAEEYEDSDPYDMVTERFDVTAEFDKSHTAVVTEEIEVDFRSSHHGIVRNIPIALDGTYDIKDISVEDYKYDVEKSGNNTVIRIGDEDKYLTGSHTYVIHYKLEYYQDDDKEVDFLAQNMLPTEWETSIRSSVLTLIMPETIDLNNMQIYAGKYGEDDENAWKDMFNLTAYDNKLVLEGSGLAQGYGVTLRDDHLPDGYWSQAESYISNHKMSFTIIVILPVLFALLSVVLWFLYGRDQKIVEVIEFYPPDNMTPAEVGYALDEELEDSEMMTMVFYLADKGYITIEKEKEHFILRKVNEIGEEEPDYVKTFFKGMFNKKATFNTSRPASSFRTTFDKAKDEVISSYKEKYGEVFSSESWLCRVVCIFLIIVSMGLYSVLMDGIDGIYMSVIFVAISVSGMMKAWKGFDATSSKNANNPFKIVIGYIVFVAGIVLLLWVYDYYPIKSHVYVYVLCLSIVFFMSLIMEQRTEKSVKIMGRLKGFRRFIKDAEYDRILALSEEDPQYYYHILPYAAILGLQTEWTKHFENMKIPKPGWYDSDDTSFLFSTIMFNEMIDSCTKSAVPPTPSSGSSGGYSGGSSGGGFSGGGGGGGGGGGW